MGKRFFFVFTTFHGVCRNMVRGRKLVFQKSVLLPKIRFFIGTLFFSKNHWRAWSGHRLRVGVGPVPKPFLFTIQASFVQYMSNLINIKIGIPGSFFLLDSSHFNKVWYLSTIFLILLVSLSSETLLGFQLFILIEFTLPGTSHGQTTDDRLSEY